MIEVSVSKELNLTNISKTNSNAWEKLIAIANDNMDDIVVFDFGGVNLNAVYLNPKFKEFLGMKNTRMRIYYDEMLKSTLEMECYLGEIDGKQKIIFVEKTVPKVVDPTKDRIDKIAQDVMGDMQVKDDTIIIETYHRFMSGVRGYDTLNGIKQAIINKLNETNLDRVILDFGNTGTEGDITRRLSEFVRACINGEVIPKKEIFISIKSTQSGMMEELSLLNCIVNQGVMTEEEKLAYIEENIPVGMVGLMTKYREGRVRSDRFGRSGNGEAIYRRVAIYRGCKKNLCGNNLDIKLIFEVYLADKFFTKEHWWSEHDGERLTELACRTIEVGVNDIGILDAYVGRKYHFYVPNQYDDTTYTPIYSFRDGEQKTTFATLPEQIKIVLDDWGIEYNRDLLDLAIRETQQFICEKREARSQK